MQEITLYINGHQADLPGDAARQIRLSKGGADVSDVDGRSGAISYTLTLPATRRNDAIFGNRSQLSRTDKFYTSSAYTASLEVSEKPILQGFFHLTSIRGGYVGRVVSDEVDVFMLLATRSLRDLSFAPWGYRGQYDFPELLALPIGEGLVCFPLVAYGNFFAPEVTPGVNVPASSLIGAPLELDDYTPSVYLSAIIRQIFADQGWTALGEPLEAMKDLCLPHVGDEYRWNWQELLRLETEPGIEVSYTNANAQVSVVEEEQDNGAVVKFTDVYAVVSPQASYNPARRYREDAALPGIQTYSVRREGGYHAVLSVHIDNWNYGDSYLDISLQLLAVPFGAPLEQGEVRLERRLNDGGYLPAGTYSLETGQPIFLDASSRLVPVVRARTTHSSDPDASTYRMTLSGCLFTVTPTDEVGPAVVDIAANLPDLDQRAVVKAFCSLGNLRFVTEPRSRAITFYFRERYELPSDFAVGLDGLAEPAAGECVPAVQARRFVFAWAEDSADALGQEHKGFADLHYDTRNLGAEGEQRRDLPFAATVWRSFSENGRRLLLPCMASQEQLQAPLNTVSWSYGYAPRLIRYTGPSEDTLPLAFMDGRHSYGTSTFNGLRWSSLYAAHYEDYLTELTHGHLLRNSFFLSPELYRQLTPSRLILYEGNLYRLSRVQGFPAIGGEVEVEMSLVVKTAIGGGKPKDTGAAQTKEFYEKEFYSGEWY